MQKTNAAGGAGRSVLGPDLTITGNITSTGEMELHGQHTGDIEAKALVVGSDGSTSGKTNAESVEILGHLDGSVSCVSMTIRSTARVRAKITYEKLVIESGAEVEGRFTYAGNVASSPAAEKPAASSKSGSFFDAMSDKAATEDETAAKDS
ncbi:MAG: polymer-forming cytoskeletal protein [Paracoccaceae bacterium]